MFGWEEEEVPTAGEAVLADCGCEDCIFATRGDPYDFHKPSRDSNMGPRAAGCPDVPRSLVYLVNISERALKRTVKRACTKAKTCMLIDMMSASNSCSFVTRKGER
jgi:hypothetical protein